MFVLAELRWPILERIPLFGDFAVSPHGIMIAVGFLAGAQVMLKRAEKRGIARRPVGNIEAHIQTILTWAAIGAIVGSRFFYIVTRPELFPNPLEWFMVWQGGLSLLGGIAGAIIFAIPHIVRHRLSVPLLMDSAAPGLALGIFVGRTGDLIIGEHLGDETNFILGWRCTGAFRDPNAPYPFPGVSPETYQGCFDAALHQTALYDFLAGGIIFAILLVLERRRRFDGFFIMSFAVLYGAGRFITDFARAGDIDLVGPLTGSQLTGLGAIVTVLVWFLVRRPDRREPYAWDPPHFPNAPTAQSDDEPEEPAEPAESEPAGGGYPSGDG
ncbi:MAG TPA: prolipoprotein diacylglyceryl transferase family protein [Egibacteraceae bacterium]|nr:prolipoprotein diacylglyceryl transferase family protein [Egibacteraceae bacterium]